MRRAFTGPPPGFVPERYRLAGEPVARILGTKEFWGLPLNLSPATLVPRPDTETVVELAAVVVNRVLPELFGRAEEEDRQPRRVGEWDPFSLVG